MSAIPSFNDLNAAATGTATNRFSEMSSEDFIKIMFTELTTQDPFQPNDSAALLDQLNSIRSIESDLNLIDRLDTIVSENQLAAGSNLIGRQITGRNAFNDEVTGIVKSVIREGDNVVLDLEDGSRVSLDAVTRIDQPVDSP